MGLSYGINNTTGRPNERGAFAILDAARGGGITTFDTARAYGDSEDIIGAWRRTRALDCFIVTKLAPLSALSKDEKAGAARRSLEASVAALGGALALVLAHRETDLLSADVRSVLDDATSAGVIEAYGASVSTVDGALRLMDHVPLAALQLPVNVADQRFAPVISRAARAGILVFARSLFLQGALLMAPAKLPPHLAALKQGIDVLNDLSRKTGRSKSELCLLAVRDRPGINSLVVGVEKVDQLVEHMTAIDALSLQADLKNELACAFAGLSEHILDPGRWPT